LLSVDMANALRSARREPCWLFWFEGDASDLYAWSGMHNLAYDGETWKGAGHVLGMSTLDRGDALSFRTQQFTLRGLDPQVLAELDESVRGRAGKVWFALRNSAGQIIPDPLLVSEVVQDTIEWALEDGNTVKLTLNTYESLKHLGRATGRKWSYESQLERFPGDVGFKYLQQNAQTGLYGIDWRQ
jgi:hypothetical protein